MEIRSGRTGELIRTLRPDPGSFRFGSAIACVEQVNAPRDSLLLVAGTENNEDGWEVGVIDAFSLTDGSARYRIVSTDRASDGPALAGCGDLDGDGCTDVAIVSGERVLLASGRGGKHLRLLPARFGPRPIDTDNGFDLDRDGCPDVIVGESVNVPMAHDGRLVVYSGRDGHPLWTERYFAPEGALVTAARGSENSWLVVAGYDTLSLFLMPGTTPVNVSGHVRSDIEPFRFQVLKLENGWLASVTVPGDVDGDGNPDLLLAGHGTKDWVGFVSSKDLPRVFEGR